MRLRQRAPSSSHFAPSFKVALVATLIVIVVYAGAVVVLDILVAHRLVAQVDRQLNSRLAAARRRSPALATEEPDSPGGSIQYGLGIYGEPIYVWEVRPQSLVAQANDASPPLPSLTWPRAGAGSVTRSLSGTDYRLLSVRYRGGLLVAGESLTELTHVESVLTNSELVAAPVLLLAIFLASLLIGLRSAKPIELAHRRQLEFTADASHELRTPLSVIEAELSLAQSFEGDPEPAVIDRIARESERLKRIVEDMLWLARFDAAPPPPASGAIDVARIAEECAERFRALASARSLNLRLERIGKAPAAITAPAEWIDRLAAVLVDNACKYANEGGSVRIEVGRIGPRIVLAVEDSGPGIPLAERERLFDRFRRGTNQAGGHGLGLAIADSVVRTTGGRWRVDASTRFGGLRIEVSWPGYQASAERRRSVSS
ncbi:MAG: HAMP domain-containing sensor histidine kinase [Acidimicrobiales bacterium]